MEFTIMDKELTIMDTSNFQYRSNIKNYPYMVSSKKNLKLVILFSFLGYSIF